MPILDPEQIVSISSTDGVLIYQFLASEINNLSWGRYLRDVSNCEIDMGPMIDASNNVPDIIPWAHWISVWDSTGKELYWKGPVYKLSVSRLGTIIHGRDTGAFMGRTRNPINKRWDAVDPSTPAWELWTALNEQQNLDLKPLVQVDPDGSRFDFKVIKDGQMIDATMADLVQRGLYWTIVCGIPVLGPMPKFPIASLGENDFLGNNFTITRDGSSTFNDVLIRGADALSRARLNMHGLNLQTIVNVDNMFGVSNVDRASYEYIRYFAVIRDRIDFQGGTQLHPDAPVTIDQLIPSVRFSISAYGVLQVMELQKVDVKVAGGDIQVVLELQTVNDLLPELSTLKANAGGSPIPKATGGAT